MIICQGEIEIGRDRKRGGRNTHRERMLEAHAHTHTHTHTFTHIRVVKVTSMCSNIERRKKEEEKNEFNK